MVILMTLPHVWQYGTFSFDMYRGAGMEELADGRHLAALVLSYVTSICTVLYQESIQLMVEKCWRLR